MSAIDKFSLSAGWRKRWGRPIACGSAVLAAIWVWMFLHHVEQTYQESGETVVVLAAHHYVPRGTPLRPALFQPTRVPKAYVTPGAVTSFDLLESSGHPRFRSVIPIPEGTQLTQREWTPITQGETLSQMIGENQVAVSFGMENVRGIGGNLQPGDLIDILHTPKTKQIMDTTPRPTRRLFQAVPVIAVGKKWDAPSRLNGEIDKEKEQKPQPDEEETTVLTVLLNSVAAVRLIDARENETLSVILRAPGDTQVLGDVP